MPLGSVSTKYRFCQRQASGKLCRPLFSPMRFSKYPVSKSPASVHSYKLSNVTLGSSQAA